MMNGNDEPTACRKLWHQYLAGEITNEQMQEQLKQFEKQPVFEFKEPVSCS